MKRALGLLFALEARLSDSGHNRSARAIRLATAHVVLWWDGFRRRGT